MSLTGSHEMGSLGKVRQLLHSKKTILVVTGKNVIQAIQKTHTRFCQEIRLFLTMFGYGIHKYKFEYILTNNLFKGKDLIDKS